METDSFLPTPPSSRIQLATELQICRALNGMWQVSGAHGHIDPDKAVESMFSYLDAGFTTWDLADHYGLPKTSSASSGGGLQIAGVVIQRRASKPSLSGSPIPDQWIEAGWRRTSTNFCAGWTLSP